MGESGRGFGLGVMKKSKLKKKLKPKKRFFQHHYSHHYYYYYFYFLTTHGNCVRVVLVTNSNILLAYKKLRTIIFNNWRFFYSNFLLILIF